jgi:2-iminobutanoate/2-iminopropanoate deaminase
MRNNFVGYCSTCNGRLKWWVRAQENSRKVILTPTSPKALGPYSQGIRVGKTLYDSGELAIDPKTSQVMSNATIEN